MAEAEKGSLKVGSTPEYTELKAFSRFILIKNEKERRLLLNKSQIRSIEEGVGGSFIIQMADGYKYFVLKEEAEKILGEML